MKNTFIVPLIIAIVVIAIFFFHPFNFMQNNQNTPINNMNQAQNVSTTSQTNSNTQTTNQAPKKVSISVMNFSFNPSSVTINKGDTVVWTNNDPVPHQIKGDSLSDLAGPAMGNEQSYSFTFNNTGTFGYHCAIHPSMEGTIIVK